MRPINPGFGQKSRIPLLSYVARCLVCFISRHVAVISCWFTVCRQAWRIKRKVRKKTKTLGKKQSRWTRATFFFPVRDHVHFSYESRTCILSRDACRSSAVILRCLAVCLSNTAPSFSSLYEGSHITSHLLFDTSDLSTRADGDHVFTGMLF